MTMVDEETVDEDTAAEHIHGICLKTGPPPRRVGVELEWLVRDARNPGLPVPAKRIAAAVTEFTAVPGLPTSSQPGTLPSGATLTTEPGGQLEISSQPADSLADLVNATLADLTALRTAAAAAGLGLAGFGLDPVRPPRRILTLPRYAAMEAFFDRGGPWGRRMMCGTASVQVCVDAGDESDGAAGYCRRWRLVHAIGPVLVAAFANSPKRVGRPTGWQSSRQQVWSQMDASRTRAPRMDTDPREAWTRYALDAQVMCVRQEGSGDWSAPSGLTFRDWVRGATDAGRLRRPTVGDLDYHLSTLFPPVRPHGHLELRMIDAQPRDGWIVPLAVTSALLEDARASDAAMAAAERLWAGHGPGDSEPWLRAARLGPADPAMARASRECFGAARAALSGPSAPAGIQSAVDAFIERYVSRDRCPADDQLSPAEPQEAR
ncbi:MAG: ergothioneine biosynthesis glutamate--cysteine ligase EgtA [Trebonia sp.]|jgi:glutamate--cysteine ligase